MAAAWCPSMRPEGSHCFDVWVSGASGDYHTGDLALIQGGGVLCVKHMAANVVHHMPGVNANVAMRQLSSPGRVPWPKVSEPLGPLDVPI